MTKCDYLGCGKPAKHSLEVPARFQGLSGNKSFLVDLCPTHYEFVLDCITPGVSTSQGRMAFKTIKSMFKTKSRKPKICPRCGYEF